MTDLYGLMKYVWMQLVEEDVRYAIISLLSEIDIDTINCWRSFEKAKGHRPQQKMQDHYLDIKQMVLTLLHSSKAL